MAMGVVTLRSALCTLVVNHIHAALTEQCLKKLSGDEVRRRKSRCLECESKVCVSSARLMSSHVTGHELGGCTSRLGARRGQLAECSLSKCDELLLRNTDGRDNDAAGSESGRVPALQVVRGDGTDLTSRSDGGAAQTRRTE